MNRRTLLASLAAVFGAALVFGCGEAEAQRGPARRRRVRRLIRRRHRRRVVLRIVNGRPVWVVPVALAVGWELLHRDRVVIVKETKVVEKDGRKVEIAVVQDSAGKTEAIEIVREDTADNTVALKGSALPQGDTTTPGVEEEVEADE
jgi:hypothetical protein